MYKKLVKLNKEKKQKAIEEKGHAFGYTLNKVDNGYSLIYKSIPYTNSRIHTINELINWLCDNNSDRYIKNLSLISKDKKFLETVTITTEKLKDMIVYETTKFDKSHILFKKVDNIDNYISKLVLVKKNVKVYNNFLVYTVVGYDNVTEFLTEHMLKIVGDCLNFSNIPLLESLYIDNFDISNVRSLYKFVYGCSNLVTLMLYNFNTKRVRDMSAAFGACPLLKNTNILSLDYGKVVEYDFMLVNTQIDYKQLCQKYNFKTEWLVGLHYKVYDIRKN